MKTYTVYMLLCSDKRFYTGISSEIEKQLSEHHAGIDPKSYTYSRRPIKLVFTSDFDDVNDAILFEKQIEGWRREKKIALIEGRFDLLPTLARAYYKRHT